MRNLGSEPQVSDPYHNLPNRARCDGRGTERFQPQVVGSWTSDFSMKMLRG